MSKPDQNPHAVKPEATLPPYQIVQRRGDGKHCRAKSSNALIWNLSVSNERPGKYLRRNEQPTCLLPMTIEEIFSPRKYRAALLLSLRTRISAREATSGCPSQQPIA